MQSVGPLYRPPRGPLRSMAYRLHEIENKMSRCQFIRTDDMSDLDVHLYGLTDYLAVVVAAILVVVLSRPGAPLGEPVYAVFGWTVVFVAVSVPVHRLVGRDTHLTVAMFGERAGR